MVLPEFLAMQAHAAIQEAQIVQRPVVVVILGLHAQDGGLDAQVDVLGDEDDRRFRIIVLQRQGGAQDFVVGKGTVPQQAGVGVGHGRLEKEPARSDA